MLAYSEVVQVTHDASNCIAAIWGSLKLMLEKAHSMSKVFDNLLEAYDQLGEAIPSLGQKQRVSEVHPQLIKIVELMYADLLEFHEHGIATFERPNWRQLFSASWKDLMPRFRVILENLSQQKELIESFARQIADPLENHMLTFHPDIEMKAKLFRTVAPKPGASKWSCGQCGRSFARNNTLKDHQLVYTGQKPHECSRCGKAFTRKYNCTRHERTHENRRS